VYELSVSLLFLLVMVGCFWGGLALQQFLRDHHRSQPSIDSVRTVITLLVTFAAVVLGLMISTSQTRFSALETTLRGFSIDITELDQRLREYGPAVDPLRADLILYTKAAIADTWPEEALPPGSYPHHLNVLAKGSVESIELGAVLNRIEAAIRRLTPDDEFHRSIAASLQVRMMALMEQRWTLIENGHRSLPWSFLAILMFWLAVIFVIAGLSSPRNLLVFTVTALAAVSLASSIFLAVDLDTPLSGFIKVSSVPLRDALLHITEPPLPPP
jgi:hypothetical protein